MMVYGHANGKDIAETLDEVGALHRTGLQGDPRAVRRPGLASTYGVSKDRMYYEPADAALPTRERLVDREVSRSRAEAVRGDPRALRLRSSHPARRAPSPDADRGGAAGQIARAVPAVLDGRSDAGREPGGLPPHPPAHGDADRGRRDLQHDLRLPDADHRAADRLHPHDGRARGRHHAPAAHRASGRALSRAHRLARRDRPVAGVHGRGAALRHVGAQLRHPGIHAAHAGDRRGVSARLFVRATATCTRAKRPGTASTSTRSSPRNTRTSRARCRSTGWKTAAMWNW